MKIKTILSIGLLLSTGAFAEQINVPNLGKVVTGTSSGGKVGLDININSGSVTATNPSVSATGAAVPASGTYAAGNKGGNLTGLLIGQQTMANSLACVLPSDQSAIPVSESGTWNITNVSGTVSLPTGASTEATLASLNGKVTAVNTGAVVVSSSALPVGASTAAKQPALGTAGTASADVITVQGIASMTALKVDNSAVTQPSNITQLGGNSISVGNGVSGTGVQRVTIASDSTGTVAATQSGTWNVTNVSGTVSLPTGASTSALQTTGNTSVASIDTKSVQQALNYGAASGAIRVASQIGNASAVADFAAGNSSAQTLRVVVASDQAAIASKAPVNSTGSGSAASATVSTVITLTAPANAVGFILMNLDTSTANLRWAVGRTATTVLGQQLQPGRDTGFVPVGANISLVAESGTQNYDVQFISQ